jgi:hypothetical protein
VVCVETNDFFFYLLWLLLDLLNNQQEGIEMLLKNGMNPHKRWRTWSVISFARFHCLQAKERNRAERILHMLLDAQIPSSTPPFMSPSTAFNSGSSISSDVQLHKRPKQASAPPRRRLAQSSPSAVKNASQKLKQASDTVVVTPVRRSKRTRHSEDNNTLHQSTDDALTPPTKRRRSQHWTNTFITSPLVLHIHTSITSKRKKNRWKSCLFVCSFVCLFVFFFLVDLFVLCYNKWPHTECQSVTLSLSSVCSPLLHLLLVSFVVGNGNGILDFRL